MAHYVYLLYKEKDSSLPFYVGRTYDIDKRIKQHKKTKDFSFYSYIDARTIDEAIFIENGIMSFFSIQLLARTKPKYKNHQFLTENKTNGNYAFFQVEIQDK